MLQIHDGYNTPKGSCWIGGFFGASGCIGREGDEAERCSGLERASSGDEYVLPGLLSARTHGVRGKAPAGDNRPERLLNEGLEDECPKPRRRSEFSFCNFTILCASNPVVSELLDKGG